MKIKSKLMVAVMLIFGITTLISCEKKEVDSVNINNDNTETSVDFKDLDVEELIAETGINIYELCELDCIQKVASNQMRVINAVSKATSTNTKGDAGLLDETLDQMSELADLIIVACNQGDFDAVFQWYEQLCELLTPLNIHIIDVNNYELQEFIYAENNRSYQLPIEQLEVEQENAIVLINEIETLYPEFTSLPEATKIDVMAAAIYEEIKDNELLIKAQEPDCKTIAKNNYAASMAVSTATFQAALIGCAVTAVGFHCALELLVHLMLLQQL